MIGTTNSDVAPDGFSHLDDTVGQQPVGHAPVVMAALTIGLLLMALQLWLLTVALDLYLAGQGNDVWRLGLVSGLIFLGGLGMLRILHRRPRVHGVTVE